MILSLIFFSASVIAYGILSIPTVWELWSERKGEAMKHKKWSALIRGILMAVCSIISAYLMGHQFILRSFVLSFAIFFLFFDYLINLILGRKPWYSYLSKSPIDQKMSKVNWKVRMAVRVLVFIVANILYLK